MTTKEIQKNIKRIVDINIREAELSLLLGRIVLERREMSEELSIIKETCDHKYQNGNSAFTKNTCEICLFIDEENNDN